MLAVILAGGRSQRMRRDKAGLLLEGRSLAQHAVDACLGAGARHVVLVAPDDAAARWVEPDANTSTTLESPPGGGPVAGVSAGVDELCSTSTPQGVREDEVLLLACDLPRVDGLVRALATARVERPDALELPLVPVDDEGWPQYLAALYPGGVLLDLLAAAPRLRDLPVRRLFREMDFVRLELPDELLVDVDEPHQALAAGITLDD